MNGPGFIQDLQLQRANPARKHLSALYVLDAAGWYEDQPRK